MYHTIMHQTVWSTINTFLSLEGELSDNITVCCTARHKSNSSYSTCYIKHSFHSNIILWHKEGVWIIRANTLYCVPPVIQEVSFIRTGSNSNSCTWSIISISCTCHSTPYIIQNPFAECISCRYNLLKYCCNCNIPSKSNSSVGSSF